MRSTLMRQSLDILRENGIPGCARRMNLRRGSFWLGVDVLADLRLHRAISRLRCTRSSPLRLSLVFSFFGAGWATGGVALQARHQALDLLQFGAPLGDLFRRELLVVADRRQRGLGLTVIGGVAAAVHGSPAPRPASALSGLVFDLLLTSRPAAASSMLARLPGSGSTSPIPKQHEAVQPRPRGHSMQTGVWSGRGVKPAPPSSRRSASHLDVQQVDRGDGELHAACSRATREATMRGTPAGCR